MKQQRGRGRPKIPRLELYFKWLDKVEAMEREIEADTRKYFAKTGHRHSHPKRVLGRQYNVEHMTIEQRIDYLRGRHQRLKRISEEAIRDEVYQMEFDKFISDIYSAGDESGYAEVRRDEHIEIIQALAHDPMVVNMFMELNFNMPFNVIYDIMSSDVKSGRSEWYELMLDNLRVVNDRVNVRRLRQ